MRIQRPWLLVVLPALSAGFAVLFTILLRVGESTGDLGRPAAFGALFGVLSAMVFTVRPPAARPPS